MKRKILCLLLALTLINIGGLSVLASTPVDVYDEGLYLYETFEEDTFAADKTAEKITFSDNKNIIEYETPGANGTKGAAHVQYKVDNSYISYKAQLVPGQKYRVSAWIKLNDISLVKEQMHFLYWFDYDENASKEKDYVRITVADAGLKKNEWVKVSTVYELAEEFGGNYVDPTAVGKIGIRFGDNGQFSNIDGYENDKTLFYDFSIDDFIVEPLVEDVTVDDSVTLDRFKEVTGNSHGRVTEKPAGATENSVKLESKGYGYVSWSYYAPSVWLNRPCKVSYWAKADLADDPNAAYSDVQVIVKNPETLKKDSRIPNYNTVNLGKVTDKWTYYEGIHYLGLNTSDKLTETDGVLEFRVRCGSAAGSIIYMNGMKIEPLDMPYQNTFLRQAPAINYTAEASTTLGWRYPTYYSGIEKIEGMDTEYRFTDTANPIQQFVQIKDNKLYKISFKAKAESYKQGSETVAVTKDNTLPIYILLDRSGTGTTGDWAANFTSETTPSRQYQYISGAALGKDAAWNAGQATSNKNWRLTDEWQEFSTIYTWDYLGNDYIMPLMSFRLGEDSTSPVAATWSIKDVKIEEVTGSVAEVKNIELDGTLAKGSKIDLSYDFTGATEGISYVRILTGSDAAGWGTLGVVKASELNGYTIPAAWVGKNLKFEVLPITTDGTIGETSNISVGTVAEVAYEFTPVFNAWTGNDVSANVAISTIPSFKSIDLKIILATYKSDESLSDVQIIPLTATGGMNTSQPISITDSEAVTAKIFILENNTLKPAIAAVPATKTVAN